MSVIWSTFIAIFSKSLSAIKGTINLEELWKVLLAAGASGGTIWTILTAVQSSLGTIITDPNVLKEVNSILTMYTNKNYVGLLFFVGAMIVDLVRRYNQGVDITPSLPVIKSLNEQHPGNPTVKVL